MLTFIVLERGEKTSLATIIFLKKNKMLLFNLLDPYDVLHILKYLYEKMCNISRIYMYYYINSFHCLKIIIDWKSFCIISPIIIVNESQRDKNKTSRAGQMTKGPGWIRTQYLPHSERTLYHYATEPDRLKKMKQEGLTFDHDFCYIILLFSSLFFLGGKRKGE